MYQLRRGAAGPWDGRLRGQLRGLPAGCMPTCRRTLWPACSFARSLCRRCIVSCAGRVAIALCRLCRLCMPRCLSWRLAVLVVPLLCLLNLLPAAQHLK